MPQQQWSERLSSRGRGSLRSLTIGAGVAFAIGATATAVLASQPRILRSVSCFFSGDVKANISSLGDRIYHVPGQKYYRETSINWVSGERRFCEEADARAAGWRRSQI